MNSSDSFTEGGAPDMLRTTPQRATQLLENLRRVISKIEASKTTNQQVRLVLVSKLKPANDILALHNTTANTPQDTIDSSYTLHFGENYAQELTAKAAILPKSIKWHMIGGLQTNKCRPLAEQVENLWCVSSVDSRKKADALEKGRASVASRIPELEKLRVLIQVNTSGEESKSGVEPSEATPLCRYIRDSCPSLQLHGLMTIGAIARSHNTDKEDVNQDFIRLRDTRDAVSKALNIEHEALQLSMGMSADFEEAILAGSNEVRVGSTIFGERPAKIDATIKVETKDQTSLE